MGRLIMSIVVEELKITTFSGRKFTHVQLREIQSTVRFLNRLSLNELALTICEHLSWKTPNGDLKIKSCLKMLDNLQKLGVVDLPLKQARRKYLKKEISSNLPKIDQSEISVPLSELGELNLQLVTKKEDAREWNALIDAHHYLGYKIPVGNALRYYILSEDKRKLGCIMFTSASAFALESRDQWIGWSETQKNKRLNLIINNSRYLVFPWVKIQNFASHVLGLSLKNIQSDWLKQFGISPVLVETFVDPTLFQGTCYKASNWIHLGKTKGTGRTGTAVSTTRKDVYVYPLEKKWKDRLFGRRKKSTVKRPIIEAKIEESFVNEWQSMIALISETAVEYDKKWQVRKRVIDSMLLVLLIFRLIHSKKNQSYGSTIQELWDNSEKLQGSLPQERAIAASSFSKARSKLDETIFKEINDKVIQAYEASSTSKDLWKGHRLFAIDGSKLILPRSFISKGFRVPSPNSYRPIGLISCLYSLKAGIPYDFELFDHENERKAAMFHLAKMKKNDVVIYDRGYYAYGLIWQHQHRGIHAVIRLASNQGKVFEEFMKSGKEEEIVTLLPNSNDDKAIAIKNYQVEKIEPLRVRLIRYEVEEKSYYLATTLVDSIYTVENFSDLYRKRWNIEECYKTGKQILEFQTFHSKSVRGVRQELYGHFVLISMSRIFSKRAEAIRNPKVNSKPRFLMTNLISNQKVLFKSMFKNLEGCFLTSSKAIKTALSNIMRDAVRYVQRQRPNRSFERRSLKPSGKWRPSTR